MPSVLFWITLLGLAASLLFSTLSYALRTMSRVQLEESLAHYRREEALDSILTTRHDLAFGASVLRLLANAVVIGAAVMYFQNRFLDAALADGPKEAGAYAWKALLYGLLCATPALLIFSVAIPQAWSKYAGETLIALMWPLLRLTNCLLYPLLAMMRVMDELIRRLAGVSLAENPEQEAQSVEQEILAVVSEGTAGGMVDEEQKKMIEGVISFRDLQVGQIMTPRTEISALEITAPLTDIREKILKEGLSRVPIFEGTLDNIVGILYAKDLLALLTSASGPAPQFDIRKLMRPPLFVPRTKPLRDLLREFRIQQVHMAIVLDEYGGTSGLVTTEDIIEEIVGDIADEYERPEPEELKYIDERVVEVDARMNLAELNRALSLHLPEDQEYQTIGGFVINTLGAIPVKGERLTHDGLAITVLESEPRRVKKLQLELPAQDQTSPTSDETLPASSG